MARPKTTGATCRRCGTCERDGARISTRRLCDTCNQELVDGAIVEMASKRGPVYQRWARNQLVALERIVAANG